MPTPPPATAKPARPAPPSAAPPVWKRAAAITAVGSAGFCIVIALALGVEHFKHKSETHPLDHPRIIGLKEELIRKPQDEQLKRQIRALDLQLRIAHDRYLTWARRGQWLLLGGAAVFLASLQSLTWRQKIARPGKEQKPVGWQGQEILRASGAVFALGLAAGGAAWWLASSSRTMLTSQLALASAPAEAPVAPVAVVPVPATPYPTPAEVAANWGRFRGPGGAGVAAGTNYPLSWNVQTGEGVLWKTKAPGPDFNSPVVWGDRLFLTTASAKRREVLCYEASSGKLLWQKPVENVPSGGAPLELSEVSGGYACPTVATDGRRVYAMFANGDLAALDYAGNLVWARSFAPIKNQYGHAASLELWRDRVIVQLDHGESDQKVSRLIAVNAADGKTLWEKPRETHGTWSTPVCVEAAGKPQIITLGLPHVIAYSAEDGAELWRVEGLEGEITPSPILASGLVLAPSPSMKLLAIRPDGSGDVTKTHVSWTAEEGIPDITCPVSDGERVYLLTTGGGLSAYDVKTGKKLWEKDLELEFKASPAVAGGRLYLFGGKGNVVVASAAGEFKELARIEMGDEITASPAMVDGRFFIRAKQTLFCVGAKGK